MKKITFKKITDFQDFNPKEFCISPWYWGYETTVDVVNTKDPKTKELFEEAKKLAQTIDGICIAIVEDCVGNYVLGNPYEGQFVLFNAVKTIRIEAEARAVVFNTGAGALTAYWFDEWIKYENGSIFIK